MANGEHRRPAGATAHSEPRPSGSDRGGRPQQSRDREAGLDVNVRPRQSRDREGAGLMSRKRRNAGMTLDTSDHPARPFRTPAFRPGSPRLAGALSACVARARQRAGQIKASPAYTTAIQSEPRPSGSGCARNRALPAQPLPHGRGSDRSPAGGDEDAPKPLLKATVQTDFAVLPPVGRASVPIRPVGRASVPAAIRMFGHDQLEIQSQRAGETEWTTIGASSGRAPHRPNPTPAAPTPTPAPRWSRASRKTAATGPAIATTISRWASGATSSK
jgi:hypothetical protein